MNAAKLGLLAALVVVNVASKVAADPGYQLWVVPFVNEHEVRRVQFFLQVQ